MIRSAERGVLAWFRDWDDFQIDGVVEECSEVINSSGSRILSVQDAELVWSEDWGVVNVTAEINDFRLISLDTNWVSREEVRLPSF